MLILGLPTLVVTDKYSGGGLELYDFSNGFYSLTLHHICLNETGYTVGVHEEVIYGIEAFL